MCRKILDHRLSGRTRLRSNTYLDDSIRYHMGKYDDLVAACFSPRRLRSATGLVRKRTGISHHPMHRTEPGDQRSWAPTVTLLSGPIPGGGRRQSWSPSVGGQHSAEPEPQGGCLQPIWSRHSCPGNLPGISAGRLQQHSQTLSGCRDLLPSSGNALLRMLVISADDLWWDGIVSSFQALSDASQR